MFVVYDAIDDFNDVEFNGDLCETCIHADYCTFIKAIQTGMTTLNSTQPLEYCEFFTGRSFLNRLLNVLKKAA